MIKRNGDNVFAIASSHNQCQGGRSSVSLSPASGGGGGGGGGGAGTRIPRATTARMTPPDAQHNTKDTNIALSIYVEKWKNRYEESERKHKSHLLKSEKAKREHDDLHRRYNILVEERNHVCSELSERERELGKLRTVSEKLFKEYQQLKHQSEVDAGLMQKVMQQAGEWYKQNKQLKRRSTVLLSALPNKVDLDLTDCTDTASDTSSNEEVEFLKQQISELSQQVAALQTEANAAKLQEFEAQEQTVALAQELEAEKEKCASQEKELGELRGQMERHNRVSKLLMEEVTALKDNADKDREMAETYKTEALVANKKVKQLRHQSALLIGELDMDARLMMLLGEVDNLKEALEHQATRHHEQIEELQLKLSEKHEDTDILVWEEKIKLAEEDAQKAIQRAERAEKKLAEVDRSKQKKPAGIMSRISYFENGGTASEVKEEKERIEEVEEKEEVVEEMEVIVPEPPQRPPSIPPPPPPPFIPPPPPPPTFIAPPPPPPPPPPAVFNVEGGDMASLLASKQGTLRKTKQANGGGAIDAIVDQIKGGKFQLKSTDQNFMERKPKEEQPEAVKEMLAILGTLRKRRSVTRPCFVASGDT